MHQNSHYTHFQIRYHSHQQLTLALKEVSLFPFYDLHHLFQQHFDHVPHFHNVNMTELQREIFCASPYTKDMFVFHVIVKCSAMHTEIKFTFSQECPN